jgi:hypothetical protein
MTISHDVCQGFPLSEIGPTAWKDMKKRPTSETLDAASYLMGGKKGNRMIFSREMVSNRIKEAFLNSF